MNRLKSAVAVGCIFLRYFVYNARDTLTIRYNLNPLLQARGWRIAYSGLAPVGRGRAKSKICSRCEKFGCTKSVYELVLTR